MLSGRTSAGRSGPDFLGALLVYVLVLVWDDRWPPTGDASGRRAGNAGEGQRRRDALSITALLGQVLLRQPDLQVTLRLAGQLHETDACVFLSIPHHVALHA